MVVEHDNRAQPVLEDEDRAILLVPCWYVLQGYSVGAW
jgi:hypothetical protein